MFCNNCGAQQPDGSRFCNNCGANIPPQPVANEYGQTYTPTQIPFSPVSPPPPPQTPNKKSNTSIIIAVVVAVVLVIAVIATAILISNKNDASSAEEGTHSADVEQSAEDEDKDADIAETTIGSYDDEENSESDNNSSSLTPDRGVTNGNVYSNSFADVTFTKPSNWYYASDEELAELIGVSTDALGYTEFQQTLIEQRSVYSMMAYSAKGYPNILMMFENLAPSQITTADYADILAEGLEDQTIANYTTYSPYEKEIDGYTYLILDAECESYGTIVYQRYYMRKIDKYMFVLIATAYEESEFTEIENMFS